MKCKAIMFGEHTVKEFEATSLILVSEHWTSILKFFVPCKNMQKKMQQKNPSALLLSLLC